MSKRKTPIFNLRSDDPPLFVQGLLGPGAVMAEEGYGGWTVTQRPNRKPITEYLEQPLWKMPVPFIFDNLARGQSIEGTISLLERMATKPQDRAHPPIVNIDGNVMHTELDWVIEDLEWDTEQTVLNQYGNTVRAVGIIHLMEYVPNSQLDKISAAQRARAKAKSKSKKGAKSKDRVVKTGETVSSIAALELGDHKRWREIADLNGIRDPNSVSAGQVIFLP